MDINKLQPRQAPRHDAQHWRQRAKQMRELVERQDSKAGRKAMLRIAGLYNEYARRKSAAPTRREQRDIPDQAAIEKWLSRFSKAEKERLPTLGDFMIAGLRVMALGLRVFFYNEKSARVRR
jgi:hypothetical protein